MFATTFVRSLNCFVLTVDSAKREAAIAWLRKRRVVFTVTVGKTTAVFTMRYLRSSIRDRLNRKFNAPTVVPAATASSVTPTFTRRSDGTYVLVVDVTKSIATHRWLDSLGCKADRIVGRDKTTFVFHVITGEAIARIGKRAVLEETSSIEPRKKHGVRDELFHFLCR